MTAIVKELNKYISQLTSIEQEQLAIALKKQLLIAESQRLSSFTPKTKVSMAEIVKEVRIVRKKLTKYSKTS